MIWHDKPDVSNSDHACTQTHSKQAKPKQTMQNIAIAAQLTSTGMPEHRISMIEQCFTKTRCQKPD